MSECRHSCRIEPVGGRPDLLARAAAMPAGTPLFYWERPRAGEAVLGVGCAHEVRTAGDGRLGEAARRVRTVLEALEVSVVDGVRRGEGSPRFVGGFAFAAEDPAGEIWREFPSCRLFLPQSLWTTSAGHTCLTTCTPCESAAIPSRNGRSSVDVGSLVGGAAAHATNGYFGLTHAGEQRHGSATAEAVCNAGAAERERWHTRVRHVLSMVAQGSVEKVVLSRSRTVDDRGDAPAVVDVLQRLRLARPGCTTFWIRGGETDFIGSTPELLVEKRGHAVETQAIAGTARRGASEAEDRELARGLADSGKDRREQQAVTRAIGEILGPLTAELEFSDCPQVMRLPEAFHLHTSIRGRLLVAISALELAGMLHPTPAVCGLPRNIALNLLAREERERGWYTGAVGWLGAEGDGAFAVALRAALIDGARTTLWAGAGIVAGSDPAAEYEETELKMRAMGSALSGPAT